MARHRLVLGGGRLEEERRDLEAIEGLVADHLGDDVWRGHHRRRRRLQQRGDRSVAVDANDPWRGALVLVECDEGTVSRPRRVAPPSADSDHGDLARGAIDRDHVANPGVVPGRHERAAIGVPGKLAEVALVLGQLSPPRPIGSHQMDLVPSRLFGQEGDGRTVRADDGSALLVAGGAAEAVGGAVRQLDPPDVASLAVGWRVEGEHRPRPVRGERTARRHRHRKVRTAAATSRQDRARRNGNADPDRR